jgi:hypothetical protein
MVPLAVSSVSGRAPSSRVGIGPSSCPASLSAVRSSLGVRHRRATQTCAPEARVHTSGAQRKCRVRRRPVGRSACDGGTGTGPGPRPSTVTLAVTLARSADAMRVPMVTG